MKSRNPSIAIAGASGLLGSALVTHFKSKGYPVKRLMRSHPTKDTSEEVYWNPASGHIERVGLEGVDIVINLAGAGIANKRWSTAQKELLLTSRLQATELLSRTIAKLKKPPEVLVSASAIGYYGSSLEQEFAESDPAGSGFLSELCLEWEEATKIAQESGIRTVHLRTGHVLGTGGGLLAKILPWFKLGVGSYVGSGNQLMSWIALSDWVAACEYLMLSKDLKGAFNLTAPNPVTNYEFGKVLTEILKRPYKMHLSERMVEWLYGEMGRVLLLEGAAVKPKRLLEAGFEFAYPELRDALLACTSK